MLRLKLFCIAFLAFCQVSLCAAQVKSAAAASTQDLKDEVAQLEKNPQDQELRTRIIQLGSQIKPAPELPKEAKGHFSKAYSLQLNAKSPQDYEMAISEYEKALSIAPWWAAAYYHLGTAYERAQQYDQAIRTFKLYLASNPKHSGEQEAKAKIENLEMEKHKAEKNQRSQ